MNILIPHPWLLEHLQTKADPQEIQRLLSLSGPSIERIHTIEDDPVYDIEVTTNRVDSMSVRGIAREAAVILSQAGIASKLLPLPKTKKTKVTKESLSLPTIHTDEKLCPRIMCQVVTNVEAISSPDWMQKRLRQVDIVPHDIIIDITNYITHALGHPCHAFDYDKVMKLGGIINVVKAKKGKSFTTLDGEHFETVGGEIVFENSEGIIIDLPGIKGTANTAIDKQTKTILFWMESIDPKSVRTTSMTHAIRTTAAQLNEKQVDPELISTVFSQGISLYQELAHGAVASDLYDFYPSPREIPIIEMKLKKFEEYLGVVIVPERIKEILIDLECTAEMKKELLFVVPPTFRPDLEIPADIIEEVARIYGYHNLPSVLMTGAIPTNYPSDTNFHVEHDAKTLLSSVGAWEMYTYSLIAESLAKQESQFLSKEVKEDLEKSHIRLANPLTDDMVYLRRTLWASHLSILSGQPAYKDRIIFEFANTYLPTSVGSEDDWQHRLESPNLDAHDRVLPFEEFHLTLTTLGDSRKMKGMLEALLRSWYVPTITYHQTKANHGTVLMAGQTEIGYFHTGTTSRGETYSVVDLQWKKALALRLTHPDYKPISKYESVIEDFTFTLPSGQFIQDVMQTITKVSPLIATLTLKDVYQRNFTLTAIYHDERNLNTEDISAIRKLIIATVEHEHQGTLVGKTT